MGFFFFLIAQKSACITEGIVTKWARSCEGHSHTQTALQKPISRPLPVRPPDWILSLEITFTAFELYISGIAQSVCFLSGFFHSLLRRFVVFQ